jgi:hypothetical protein
VRGSGASRHRRSPTALSLILKRSPHRIVDVPAATEQALYDTLIDSRTVPCSTSATPAMRRVKARGICCCRPSTIATQAGCGCLPYISKLLIMFGVPDGIRTRVTAVKGRCPRPLDDGDAALNATPPFYAMNRLQALTDGLFSYHTSGASPGAHISPRLCILQKNEVICHSCDVIRSHTRGTFALNLCQI